MNVAELKDQIAAHAGAVIAGNHAAADAFVLPAKLDAWSAIAASLKQLRPKDFELMACARIGQHFMAKTRFNGPAGSVTLLVRWKNADGQWKIADAEDITGKRSPWSDILHYTKEGAANA